VYRVGLAIQRFSCLVAALLATGGCVVALPDASQPRGIGVDLVERVVTPEAFLAGPDCGDSNESWVDDDSDFCEPFPTRESTWASTPGPLRRLAEAGPPVEPPPAWFNPVPTRPVFSPHGAAY
jgi:hypothetical protein